MGPRGHITQFLCMGVRTPEGEQGSLRNLLGSYIETFSTFVFVFGWDLGDIHQLRQHFLGNILPLPISIIVKTFSDLLIKLLQLLFTRPL